MEKNSVRITLRISEQLHELLIKSAEKGTRSLNSEIVKRLEWSYEDEKVEESLTHEDVRKIVREELAKAGKG